MGADKKISGDMWREYNDTLVPLLTQSQDDLLYTLPIMLRRYYGKKKVIYNQDYIYAQGNIPVLLVAHLDTVHDREPYVEEICCSKAGLITAPYGIGGDDRCGVFALVSIIKKGMKPHVVFTTDEEIGCLGASAFAKSKIVRKNWLKDIKFIVEIDRKGTDDCVFYDCDNKDFMDMVEDFGFVTEWGSYSDICEIAPEVGVSAVNLSSGYFNPHTEREYISLYDLINTRNKVVDMLTFAMTDACPRYEWVERASYYYGYGAYDSYTPAKTTTSVKETAKKLIDKANDIVNGVDSTDDLTGGQILNADAVDFNDDYLYEDNDLPKYYGDNECYWCGDTLGKNEVFYTDRSGNVYCRECAMTAVNEGLLIPEDLTPWIGTLQ